ncbi:hypothetical protein ABEB36_000487 [Hypothenemus hampei]|uniref:Uncharacterized protein n=1 Tax=Hypothenemus hampei TaxID=57062 RepID=A0ABD1FBF9_HYPHA
MWNFHDFPSEALIKDSQKQPTYEDLLKPLFIYCTVDAKPIQNLLLEYNAVQEEPTNEDPEHHRRSNASRYKRRIDCHSNQRYASKRIVATSCTTSKIPVAAAQKTLSVSKTDNRVSLL